MKPTLALRKLLLGSTLLAAATTAHAQTQYYWDANGTGTAGFGAATGTWGTNVFINTSSTGSGGTISANPPTTTADTLNLGTTALALASGTITVNGTRNIGSIVWGTNNGSNQQINITGGTVNFGTTGNLTYNNANVNAYFASTLTGASTLNFNGNSAGRLVFDSALTGDRTINIASTARADFAQNQTGTGGSIFNVDGALRLRTGQVGPVSGAVVTEFHIGELNGASTGTIARGGTAGGSATIHIGAEGTNSTFSGVMLGTEFSINKVGGGTLTLDGGNTYSGGTTTITAGTLQIGAGATTGALASGTAIINNAALIYNRSNAFAVSNDITGTGTLEKIGVGVMTLSSATASYSGGTTVTGGTLAVNTTLSSSNNSVTVKTGATLQGNGSINSSVTIEGGGTLASGNSIESLAMGTLTQNADSIFAYEIDKSVSITVSGDLTAVTGDLNLAGTNNTLLTIGELNTLVGGTWDLNEKLTLISYTGTWNGGLFDYVGANDGLGGDLADDSTFVFSGATWRFNYNDTLEGANYATESPNGESYVTMTVIPEPGTALLGGLGILMLLRRRRN